MPENSDLMNAARAAGSSRIQAERGEQNARAVRGAFNFAGEAVNSALDIWSRMKRLEEENAQLAEARQKEDFSKLESATNKHFGGNSTFGVPGALDDITEATSDYNTLDQSFQDALSEWMNPETLSQSYGVTLENAEAFVEQYTPQYSDLFHQSAEAQKRSMMIADNQLDYGGSDGTGGKLALIGTDLNVPFEKAMANYKREYDSSHPEIWDPQGNYSLDNKQNLARVVAQRSSAEAFKAIEDSAATTDMTIEEMVEEGIRIYDERIKEYDFSDDSNAQLASISNRDAIEEGLRTHAKQVAGQLVSEADSKGIRLQNHLTELYETGVDITDDVFSQAVEAAGLTPGNLYDEAKIRDLKITQFGYDKDLTGRHEAVDTLLSSDDFVADLAQYTYTDETQTSITVLDRDIGEAFASINSDSAQQALSMLPQIPVQVKTGENTEQVVINTRYGNIIQEAADKYGLSAGDVQYMARSINQKVATVSQQNSEYWEDYINQLIASPDVTEGRYTEELINLRNAGWISDETYNTYKEKKSSEWQKEIDQAKDAIRYAIEDLYGKDGSAVWERISSRADFNDNVDRFITNMMATKGQYDDKAVSDLVDDYVTVLRNDDITDMIYKDMDQIMGAVFATPAGGQVFENANLSQLMQDYYSSDYSLYFSDDAIGAGTLYLQGTAATRTPDGLYDTVAKALYGNNATYADASEYEKEIIKANGAIAVGQYAQYTNAAKAFSNNGKINMHDVFVRGEGKAAMDDEGYFYLEQEDGSFMIGYVYDANLRKQLTQQGNTDRVINMATDGISWEPYRIKQISYPVMQEVSRANEYNGGHTDQYYGFDLSMSEQDDPAARAEWEASNPEIQPPPEAYMPRTLIYRPLNPNDDPVFIGIKYKLKEGRR